MLYYRGLTPTEIGEMTPTQLMALMPENEEQAQTMKFATLEEAMQYSRSRGQDVIR